jgi:hypothetical protein
MFCRVDIKEVQSLKHTFNIESTPTFKILIAEEQVIRVVTHLHLCRYYSKDLFGNSCVVNSIYRILKTPRLRQWLDGVMRAYGA